MPIEKLDLPSQVSDAIVEAIRGDLLASGRADIEVKDYEDWGPADKSDRCILVEFSDIGPLSKSGDGRHPQDQEIVFYVLVSMAQKRAAREAGNIASSLLRKLWDNRWGISHECIGAPSNFSAAPAFFTQADKGKAYEAWEVRFRQIIKYGDSKWPDPIEGGKVIALAVNSDNPADPNEYQEVVDGS